MSSDLNRRNFLGNAAGALATTQVSHHGISSYDDVVRLIEKGAP